MKKFFYLCVTFILLFTAVGTMPCIAADETTSQETGLRFDMNNDGILNVFDLVCAKDQKNLEASYFLQDYLLNREVRDMYPLTVDLDTLPGSSLNRSYLEDLMNESTDISVDYTEVKMDGTTENQITVTTPKGTYLIKGTLPKVDVPVFAITDDYYVWHDTVSQSGVKYLVAIIQPNVAQFQLVVVKTNSKVVIRQNNQTD